MAYYTSISKQKAVEILGEVKNQSKELLRVKTLKSGLLRNAWVKNVNMGEFEYASDDMLYNGY